MKHRDGRRPAAPVPSEDPVAPRSKSLLLAAIGAYLVWILFLSYVAWQARH